MTSQANVTRLLTEVSEGKQAATDELFQLVYRELRALAKDYLRRERADHTLQPTALVHEAYVRLAGGAQVGWQSRAQFFVVAAQAMRNILVDHARRHKAGKRGGGEPTVLLDEALDFTAERDLNLVALGDALKVLEDLDPQQSRIVELRFFGGLKLDEVAAVMQISERTVSREWLKAKLWLRKQLDATTAT